MPPLSALGRGQLAPGAPTPDDWFSQQGAPPMAPPAGAVPPGGPIQDGMASAQQSLTALQNSPGYQFRMGEGLKALERSAAARGTLLTGGTLKGLTRFGQDFASNEYGQRANQLSNLANVGANAAGMQTGQNSQYGNNAGNLLTGIGNANAAGTAGSAGAWNQGLQGAGNAMQQAYLMWLYGQQGAGGGAMATVPTPSFPIASGVPSGFPGSTPPPRWG